MCKGCILRIHFGNYCDRCPRPQGGNKKPY
ncbi:MAG: hypothetical protein UY15_C0028G0007 [Parcubacteria group bacterium GW2011_GWA2_47_9]|nr:MAG: hypothetical protein UY15_C0028G0007 [Parcubacteria group bacterium GW2011_GWA2_47_9]